SKHFISKKEILRQLVASKQSTMYFQTTRYVMTISSNDNSVNYELMLAPCSKVIRVCQRSLTKFQHVVLLPTQKHKTATREIDNKKRWIEGKRVPSGKKKG
ncbi:hypothetical protein CEJ83_19865, partial [Acinetobacter baumannii]